MLTSKERAYLRGEANTLTASYQIGKGGITETVCQSLNEALEANELIKVKILENADIPTKSAAVTVAAATNSNIVQCIGRVFVLFKAKREKEKRKYLK